MTTPDLSKVSRHTDSALAAALSRIDRDAIQKDIDAGQWKAASREEVVRAANQSLRGTGLAMTLPMLDMELFGEGLIKYTVSGWLMHEGGERIHCHWPVTGPIVSPRTQTQADGAAGTYAAKNCILNTLSLPRGGNEQTELAHMEDYNGKDARRPTTGHQPRRPKKA